MNKIPYFTEDEQDVIDVLFEEYWDTPNKKIEYVRDSEWEVTNAFRLLVCLGRTE